MWATLMETSEPQEWGGCGTSGLTLDGVGPADSGGLRALRPTGR